MVVKYGTFNNQSENAFILGPMEYRVISSSFGLGYLNILKIWHMHPNYLDFMNRIPVKNFFKTQIEI